MKKLALVSIIVSFLFGGCALYKPIMGLVYPVISVKAPSENWAVQDDWPSKILVYKNNTSAKITFSLFQRQGKDLTSFAMMAEDMLRNQGVAEVFKPVFSVKGDRVTFRFRIDGNMMGRWAATNQPVGSDVCLVATGVWPADLDEQMNTDFEKVFPSK